MIPADLRKMIGREQLENLSLGSCLAAAPRLPGIAQRARHTAQRQKQWLSYCCLVPVASCLISSDHLIRAIQHRLRYRYTDLLGRFEIDHKLKLSWLFYRQVGGLGTFENLVDVCRRAPIEIIIVSPVRHKAAHIDKLFLKVNSRQPVVAGKLDDSLSFGKQRPIGGHYDRVDLFLFCVFKGSV